MPALQFEAVRVKSALNRVSAPSMPFPWSLNPYRSCSHACPYCYARSYHEWLELNPGDDFESRILVKENLPDLLRRELSRRTWRKELVAIGTAVDPYQPAEGKYRLTRRALELLAASGTPVSITTKNSMILRDLDVLQELARGPGCVVNISVTTLDLAVARRIEPGATPPARRLEVVERLAAAGIPAGVMLAPILPGITDAFDDLARLIEAAARHRAAFLIHGVLRLSSGVREVYFEFLRREFPRLVGVHERLYAKGPWPPERYRRAIASFVEKERARWGIAPGGEERYVPNERKRSFGTPAVDFPIQLSLFNL